MLASMLKVCEIQREINAKEHRAARNAAIVLARDAGWSFDALAAATSMSREHIRQIDKKTRAPQ